MRPWSATRQLALAWIHHANQYRITTGYDNRAGLDEFVDRPEVGYGAVLDAHVAHGVPCALNISGTLIEALQWYRPEFLSRVRRLVDDGLVELIGSCYGQNIMRFFSSDHNRRQLDHQLALYRDLLGVDPATVRVFWPPERVWDTPAIAPVVADPGLLNGGYRYVLLDDRLRFPLQDGAEARHVYDREPRRRPGNFRPYRLVDGHGLIALPISIELRQAVPPGDDVAFRRIEDLLRWLHAEGTTADTIAIYGDDMEKAGGAGGWHPAGPGRLARLLEWTRSRDWIDCVLPGAWMERRAVVAERQVDVGTFVEMSCTFGAGEGYEKWFHDPRWTPYQACYEWSEARVESIAALGADPVLIELARKHLLGSVWETAWHTPAEGVHGSDEGRGEPSPWIKAVTSHSRHAAVIAEAALWAAQGPHEVTARCRDLDNDGEEELLLSNDRLFAVISPLCGGRLVYLFSRHAGRGAMVIGNPGDDWNWMEELNRYMKIPANHPGALTDVGFESDAYEVRRTRTTRDAVRVELVNRQAGSALEGGLKRFALSRGSNELIVEYRIPDSSNLREVEFGFSPDYLDLLRSGRTRLRELNGELRGFSNNGVAVWLRLDDGAPVSLGKSGGRAFGHGVAIRARIHGSRFGLRVGAGDKPPAPGARASEAGRWTDRASRRARRAGGPSARGATDGSTT